MTVYVYTVIRSIMPKPFTDPERERIATRLILAGKRLLNQGGVKRLTVEEVSKEAGIAKGSFYAFFPSKEDLILSIFESWEDEYRGSLMRLVAEGEGSPRERLERFFRGTFSLLEREPALASLGSGELERIVERLPPERIAAHAARDGEELGARARRWIEAGILAPVEPETLEGAMLSLFFLALHRGDFPGGRFEAAAGLLSEALALRLAAPGGAEGRAR